MQQIEPLNYGKFYHIYNRGVDRCDLFVEHTNYEHFLNLYDKYILPVADTYAWVLMKNHFHLLVRVKEESEIGFLSDAASSKFTTLSGCETTERVGVSSKKYNPVHQFSHLFNAYAQAFNKRYGRTGSLFIHPFKRKLIEDVEYFKNLIVYIHNNPVHHKFTEHAMDYPWSSYLTCISIKPTHLHRDTVMGWFNNKADFISTHDKPGDFTDLEQWLELL
jgi:REP element-mobilizing transposase RayT